MGLWVWSGCGTVITPVAVPTPTGGAMPPASSRVTATATLAPAAFLTPIPPTPTLTPSPSPTPVVHYVASGDTLFGIALEYGVTVDALLHANGLDVNEYLDIGQALIIPLQAAEAELPLAAEPLGNLILPTPTPQPLELVGVSLRRTAVGGLLCLGAVRNVIGVPVTNLQVQAVLVDAAGNPLAQQTALAAVDYLQPEQRAPFAVTFLDPPAQAVDVRVALLRAETISAITEDFVPLTVADLDAGMSGPQYRVTGSLVNASGGPVTLATVVITLFDAEGLVLGYREAMLEDVTTLDPGARAAFSMLLTFQGETPPAAYEALAWATRVH
ncbi:MAG TPA: FxLYD domain-containing protein [Anaerolineae bacterium]|nr:FxLYD domain-containing protein [Anaerolineae bacterium]